MVTRAEYFRGRMLDSIKALRSRNNPSDYYLVILALNANGGMAGAW